VRRRFWKALPTKIYAIQWGPRKIEDFMGHEEGALAIARERMTVKPGWVEKRKAEGKL